VEGLYETNLKVVRNPTQSPLELPNNRQFPSPLSQGGHWVGTFNQQLDKSEFEEGIHIKVCFIGACGNSQQASKYLAKREDVVFAGFALGSHHETPELLEEFLAGGGIPAEEIFYLTRVALIARNGGTL